MQRLTSAIRFIPTNRADASSGRRLERAREIRGGEDGGDFPAETHFVISDSRENELSIAAVDTMRWLGHANKGIVSADACGCRVELQVELSRTPPPPPAGNTTTPLQRNNENRYGWLFPGMQLGAAGAAGRDRQTERGRRLTGARRADEAILDEIISDGSVEV